MVGDEVEEPDIRLPAAEMGKRIGGQIKFLKERPLALLAAAIEALEQPRRVDRPEGEQGGPFPYGAFMARPARRRMGAWERSEGHTSELQSLMRNSYAVF